MTVVVMLGAMTLFYAVARTWAKRCGERLTLRDPAMWLLAVAATVETGFASALHITAVVVLALVAVCALTDRQTGYIFNAVLVSATPLILLCVVLSGSLESSVLGAAVCGGAMLVLHIATCRRGLGLGDVKLAALIGAGLAPPAGLVALGAAFVSGALVVAATAIVRRVSTRHAIAFGPYLAVGSMVSIALEIR